MSLTKTVVPRPDGGVDVKYHHDDEGGTTSVLYSGPWIFGSVKMTDGTVYEINEPVTEVSRGHLGESMHHVGIRFEEEGHPNHSGRVPDGATAEEAANVRLSHPFVHACDDTCGEVARPIAEILASYDRQLSRLGHGDLIGSSEHETFTKTLRASHTAHVKRRKAILANSKADNDG